MSRNQHKDLNLQYNKGFTAIELLVVFLIIVTLSSLVLIYWNQQSPNRSLTIGQNETITNIRKAQNYAVTSRNTSTGESVKYYAVRLGVNDTQYTINAVDKNFTYFPDLETIKLPDGLVVSSLELTNVVDQTTSNTSCVFIIYSSVFGKVYFDSSGVCDNNIATTVQDLPILAGKSDYTLKITLTHSLKGISKQIIASGITGRIDGN